MPVKQWQNFAFIVHSAISGGVRVAVFKMSTNCHIVTVITFEEKKNPDFFLFAIYIILVIHTYQNFNLPLST